MKIKKELYSYINNNVLPLYSDDKSGHGTKHIEYVIRRCEELSHQIPEVDINILYTAAAYHDIAHKIDKKNHEKLSAQMFLADEAIKTFFDNAEIKIIKEAIEDHRASADHSPRSIYGKILSSADRSTDVDEFLQRTHAYTLKHFPDSSEEDVLKRAITHTSEKYGEKGYAKHYLPDPEYDNFINEIQYLLSSESIFKKRYNEATRGTQ